MEKKMNKERKGERRERASKFTYFVFVGQLWQQPLVSFDPQNNFVPKELKPHLCVLIFQEKMPLVQKEPEYAK